MTNDLEVPEAPSTDDVALPTPTRVCRKCSTQATTAGDYCAYCGASYSGKTKLGRRGKLAIVFVVLVAVAAGVTVLTLQRQHANKVRRAAAVRAEQVTKKKKAATAAKAKLVSERRQRVQGYIDFVSPRFEDLLILIEKTNGYGDELHRTKNFATYTTKTNRALSLFSHSYDRLKGLNPQDPELGRLQALLTSSIGTYWDILQPEAPVSETKDTKAANQMRAWHSRLLELARSSGADAGPVERAIQKHRKKIFVF